MGGGESEKEEDWPEPSVSGVVDAPILFFVVTHKAFRAELASIRRVAVEAAEAETGAVSDELVVDLGRRLEFLKLVYDYHSVAEDEVIFLALDAQIKNIVSTYSLEHSSIDDSFSVIFHYLDLLMKKDDEDAPQMFQDFISSIGTVQTMICHHMHKEEEQVFPLLMEKFSPEAQCQLVWQYMCCVPTILLEEFFPWMTLYLTSDEKLDVLHCVKLIVPKERLLQEVVVSWIQHESSSSGVNSMYGKRNQLLTGLSNKDIHKLHPLQISCDREQQFNKACSIQKNCVEEPVEGIHIWHAALRRDLNQIIEELHHIRSSNCSTSLSSVIVQLKFIADVLIFYSNSLDKIFCNLSSLVAENSMSPCSQLIDECQIKGLQRLLLYESRDLAQLEESFVEMLYQELESLVRGLGNNLMLLETEVFPSITKSFTGEMQMWLLHACLYMMPLGLLRCTITWFSSHLTESQSKSILKKVELGCPAISKSFTSLLCEWVRIGCSGKISAEKFRNNLEEMFNGRSFYLAEQKRQKIIFSDWMFEQNSTTKMKISADFPSSSAKTGEHGIFFPSEMNISIFFSQKFKGMPPLQGNLVESDHATSLTLEFRPMDLVFYIHRGLIKDLEYLVSLSAKLAANVGFLAEFTIRFKLLRSIYQIHSNSEDDIVFPALESKGALQNISHSYEIDHKLEFKYFTKTSTILEEISELQDHPGSSETRRCLDKLYSNLHRTCLSMRKVLSDHIYREEVEIFPLFRESFSIDEEEKIIGHMLGRTKAEILQEMIPWLMAHITSDEQQAVMSLWLKVARHTKFDEWLREWWEGMAEYNISTVQEGSRPPDDPLEVVSMYLLKESSQMLKVGHNREAQMEFPTEDCKHCGSSDVHKSSFTGGGKYACQSQDLSLYRNETDKKRLKEADKICHDVAEITNTESQKLSHHEHPLSMNQEELEAAIQRVSRDPNLSSQKKTYLMQNFLMSRWVIMQKMHNQASEENQEEDIPGQSPSYRDPLGVTFGCKHYRRNCKLLAPCCNKLYTCIRCHDDLTDHSVDRKAITKMMCMKCLVIQPIGQKCMSQSCGGFSMGKYYCRICKLFDDERQIYHCPYCNLCRVGKGLGNEYFHCMKCNACMGKYLFVHVCREKCLEDNCPICHEYIFTSNSPVKQLPCGHLMHSSCFQDYTCSHYICPICSKSLGDMQVYFGMLDALLAEQKMPEEYSGRIQVILCNDCEKRGTAPFHWLYHKCPHCGSYNTRLL